MTKYHNMGPHQKRVMKALTKALKDSKRISGGKWLKLEGDAPPVEYHTHSNVILTLSWLIFHDGDFQMASRMLVHLYTIFNETAYEPKAAFEAQVMKQLKETLLAMAHNIRFIHQQGRQAGWVKNEALYMTMAGPLDKLFEGMVEVEGDIDIIWAHMDALDDRIDRHMSDGDLPF